VGRWGEASPGQASGSALHAGLAGSEEGPDLVFILVASTTSLPLATFVDVPFWVPQSKPAG